ncbi:MAG: MnhB domain-containing protein [Devosia sp.]|jgi:multicomponent Na+:H+ antiporter subunit B|nr:MnhB domain-containing protein [Devosia sp.]
MNTLIFRTMAPLITVVMVVFSVFVLLRGHNEPGGGFIGGLIAGAAMALYSLALGTDVARRALRIDPVTLAAVGLGVSVLSGMVSLPLQLPFLTGLWGKLMGADISTPLFFDIGVYLVVAGTLSALALGLEEEGDQ